MTNYLFSAGTARGGTGLMAHMLSVHPKVKVVSDPVLALYKAFRNSAVSQSGDAIKEHFDLESPLGDYYFTDDRRRILDLIGSSDLNVEFDQKEWPNLKATLKKRALLASADIVPHIDALSGATYREIFENCLAMLKRVRSGGADLDWIGIHENWTIEFFLPLARAFPSAKFAVVIRDPRAVITSNFREKDKSRIGHLVSYARCHRKLIACASYFETLPLFKDRLFVLRYEDMLLNPSDKCKSLCDFLNVQFIEDMLDTTKYINHATGGVHDGLSNYEENAQGFNPARIGRWKEHLSPNRANLIDFFVRS